MIKNSRGVWFHLLGQGLICILLGMMYATSSCILLLPVLIVITLLWEGGRVLIWLTLFSTMLFTVTLQVVSEFNLTASTDIGFYSYEGKGEKLVGDQYLVCKQFPIIASDGQDITQKMLNHHYIWEVAGGHCQVNGKYYSTLLKKIIAREGDWIGVVGSPAQGLRLTLNGQPTQHYLLTEFEKKTVPYWNKSVQLKKNEYFLINPQRLSIDSRMLGIVKGEELVQKVKPLWVIKVEEYSANPNIDVISRSKLFYKTILLNLLLSACLFFTYKYSGKFKFVSIFNDKKTTERENKK